jgi:hypothetical protein
MVLPLYNHGLALLTARKGGSSSLRNRENTGRQQVTTGYQQ